MNEPPHQRPRFTLMQLLVAVTVICMLLAVLVPLIAWQQRESKRNECANNLRQLAISIHNYHDVNNQLPPLVTDKGCWTWIALNLPFIGLQREYLRLRLDRPAANRGNLKEVIGLHGPWLLCPARRTSVTRTAGPYQGGQPTDYIAVSTSTSLNWSSKSDGMIVFRLSPPTATSVFSRSATTFGSVTDGLSNTAMIGEKHMQPAWLGGKWDEPALVALNNQNTIRVATDAIGPHGLARNRSDPDSWKFGSWHEGVVLFARGDASVVPVSVDTDPAVLRLFTCRNDGRALELP